MSMKSSLAFTVPSTCMHVSAPVVFRPCLLARRTRVANSFASSEAGAVQAWDCRWRTEEGRVPAAYRNRAGRDEATSVAPGRAREA